MKTGDIIGPYVILDLLGKGGMGEVYRARDTRLEREVALKRLSDPELAGDVARRRVLNEARAAGALTHPNIAAIHDVLDTPDGPVIVMEYVAGESLSARLRHGPLSVDEALRIARQITDALAEAHERGIVHRDLKPANVIMSPSGRAKILDFGIARSAPERREPLAAPADMPTEPGQIIGTPGYMAPEQLAGGRADPRTDIYGVGILLFEMLTGRRPFEASDYLGHALAVFEGPVPRVTDLAPHVPAGVSDIVSRAMARRPQDRFSDARELSGAIDQALHALSNAVTIVAPPQPRRPWWRSRAASGVAVGLLLVAIAAGTRARWWPPPPSARSSVIGVLPFRNESGDAADDALVVGLSDAVSKRLASVRSLRVVPLAEIRDASREQPDPAKLARILGAGYVVDGTLQRAGESLAVRVSLVFDDGTRQSVGQFNGRVDKLLELHRDVADALMTALAREGVAGAAPASATAAPTANLEAFTDYQQAITFLERPDVTGNLDRAIALFQGAIKKDKRYSQAYAGLGEAYWAQYNETHDPAWTLKAQEANMNALSIDPAQPEVRMALAVMFEGSGSQERATEELQRVIALQPGNDNAHLLMAKIHADRSEWDTAVAEAQKAIALRPNYWRNHAEFAEILRRAGRLDEAISAYRRLVELQPDSTRAFQRLGTALQRAGRIDEALESYEKAHAIRPSYSTYSNIGVAQYWRGNMPKAIEAFRSAIALAPKQPDPYANLGDALQKTGHREQAAQNYRMAVELVRKKLSVKAQDAVDMASLALYQAKLGAHAEAKNSIRRALELAPQDGDVLNLAALVHALGGDPAAACAALGDALLHGASPAEVQHADELVPLKGCAAYDRVIQTGK